MSNKQQSEMKPFNAINWFEIPTRDMDRAVAFYEKTLHRTLKREVFAGLPHAVFPARGVNGPQGAVAGALVADGPHLVPGANGTIVYLDCPDGIAATLSRARAQGANVVQPHTAIGENGFIAVIDDLEGNRIGLHSMTA